MCWLPARLSARAVSALAVGELGAADAEFTVRCHEATAGNPLLVRELLRAAREDALAPTRESAARLEALAAQRLGDRVVRRLARLSGDARELAGAVAVLGSGRVAPRGRARRARGAARPRRRRTSCTRAGLLADELPLRFAHPLLGAAVEADLPPARRASAHRRAAVLLDADHTRAEEAIVHLLRADPAADPWAVERLSRGRHPCARPGRAGRCRGPAGASARGAGGRGPWAGSGAARAGAPPARAQHPGGRVLRPGTAVLRSRRA